MVNWFIKQFFKKAQEGSSHIDPGLLQEET